MSQRGKESASTMKVREQFAAMALQGLLAHEGATKHQLFVSLPQQAVKMADSLLEYLSLPPEEVAKRLERGEA